MFDKYGPQKGLDFVHHGGPAAVVAVGVLDEVWCRVYPDADVYEIEMRGVVTLDPPLTRWFEDCPNLPHTLDGGGLPTCRQCHAGRMEPAVSVGSLSGPWGVVPDGLAAAIQEAMT